MTCNWIHVFTVQPITVYIKFFFYFICVIYFFYNTVTPKSGLPGERFPDPSNAAGSSPYLDKVKVSAKNKTNKKLKVSNVISAVKGFLCGSSSLAFSSCDRSSD